SRHCFAGRTVPDHPGAAYALPDSRCAGRWGQRVRPGIRAGLPAARPAAVRPATALAEAERGGRARAADPHRGILPGVSLLAGVGGIEPRTAPVGTHLQHGSPAPGLGLSHPAAVSAAECSTTKAGKR